MYSTYIDALSISLCSLPPDAASGCFGSIRIECSANDLVDDQLPRSLAVECTPREMMIGCIKLLVYFLLLLLFL